MLEVCRSTTLRVFSAALLIAVGSLSSSAQSVLNFPRVISTPQVFTGIAVGNPTPSTVTVTFTAYEADGSLVAGSPNPTTAMVPAGGQLARQYTELFGTGAFNGWVEATSASSGLTGFFLNGNPSVTDLDGALAPDAGVEFVLPFAVEDGTARTELTVVNVGGEVATATLILHSGDGQILATKDVVLAAKALSRQTLRDLFDGADLALASHVMVRGDRPLVTHAVVADFQVAGTELRRETIAFGGRVPSEAPRQILPQFVTGAGWLSFLGLVNTAATAQDVVVTARQDDGASWDLPSNPRILTLSPNGGWRGTVADLFGITDGAQLRTGWIDIQTPLGFVTSYIGFGNQGTPSFALVSGVETPSASKLQVYSQVAEGGGFFTGLTVVNPSETAASIDFFTLLPDGTTVGEATLTVPANGRIGRLYRELVPASLNQVGGWAYLRSTVPVVGTSLFGGTNGFALANVPADAIEADFIPPVQVAAAITGTVRQDGVGVEDVTVTLVGPVNSTIKTDREGRFIFVQLPPGSYGLTASRVGAQLVPAQRTVQVDLANVSGQDFDAGGVVPADAPALSFITPTSTFSGNRLLNITVLGSNFNPASVVQYNKTDLQTTFVSATELQAVIPSTLLIQIGNAEVTVHTPPPGGGSSAVTLFVVNPEPDNPLIEGRVSVGSFPAGVAIHSGRKIALVTSESDDSVSVIDLEKLTVTETIAVGRSPGEGIAIHPGLDLAVVVNVGSNDVSLIDLTSMTVTTTIDVGRFPIGVGIDTTRNLAVVANGEDANVSIIDLSSKVVTGTIQVGPRPSGVAVNSKTGIAVVSNRAQNTVSVIDLDARSSVATIGIEGDFPRGVAINETKNIAIVANANSNTVSVIDLETMSFAGTVDVGTAPTGVAIHELTNHAVVTNSGVTRGSTELGSLTTATILDLDGRVSVDNVPVGSAAFGVDVDEASQLAVVANFGSNDVTVIRIPNPTPRVGNVEPKTFPAGGGEFEITIRGTGFLSTSVVTLNGQTLPTTFVSPTELKAVVSADILDQLLQVSAITLDSSQQARFGQTTPIEFNIGVTNPGPGGGESPPPADPQVNQIQPQNSQPILRSMSPTEIETGASEVLLTVNGNNFNGTSVLNFGGSPHSPISSTPTSMTVLIPGSDLIPGVVSVSVTNPPPGGGTSGSNPFTVTEQANPVPVIDALTPGSVPAGSASVGLSISGSGFIADTVLNLGGRQLEVSITPESLDAIIPADLLSIPGTLSGLVSNPTPGGGAASFTINVLNEAPTIDGFDPTSVDVGGDSLGLTVSGSNFAPNATITVDGTRIPTQFVSASQLTGTIPGVLLQSPAQLAIGVFIPPPGGGSAAGGSLAVQNPAPTLTSLDPPTTNMDALPVRVTVTGRGFLPTSEVQVDGNVSETTFISTTSLSFNVSVVSVPAVLSVTVVNPQPGGGASDSLNFTIGNPVPVIVSLDSTEVAADDLPVTITVTGTGLVATSQVELNQTAAVSDVSIRDATSLTFTVPAGTVAGEHEITVVNPLPGGGRSNAVSFKVTNPLPILIEILPDTGEEGESHVIDLIGANFIDGVEVLVDGVAIATRFTASTRLSGTIPASRPGKLSISTRNPGGVPSNALDFTVTFTPSPAPSIVSITPDPSRAEPGDTLTVVGTGFIPGTELLLDGQLLAFTFVGSNTVTIVVPTIQDGSHTVTLTNLPSPGGGGGSSSIVFRTGTSISSLQLTLMDVSTKQVISGATLVLDGSTATTDASGIVQFSDVLIGSRSMQVTATGYLGRSFDTHLVVGTTSLVVYVYPTSVGAVDTDGDGLPDAVESNTGIFLSITDTGTDPNKADTDGDGLPDGVEVLR